MKDWYNDATEEDLTESHQKFLDVLPVHYILELCEAFGGVKTHIPKNDEVYKKVVRNRAIREQYVKGVKISVLAYKYGLSESSVGRIVRGCTSAHTNPAKKFF